MNPLDHALQRLLGAAAQAPRQSPVSPPFALEAGVLAQWRAAGDEDELVALLAGLFRRAVVCASLVTVLSIVWSYQEGGDLTASALALADYQLSAYLLP